jgi:hypothetical protein
LFLFGLFSFSAAYLFTLLPGYDGQTIFMGVLYALIITIGVLLAGLGFRIIRIHEIVELIRN